jgi:hypothetical protein
VEFIGQLGDVSRLMIFLFETGLLILIGHYQIKYKQFEKKLCTNTLSVSNTTKKRHVQRFSNLYLKYLNRSMYCTSIINTLIVDTAFNCPIVACLINASLILLIVLRSSNKYLPDSDDTIRNINFLYSTELLIIVIYYWSMIWMIILFFFIVIIFFQ